jgi:hypothetical protein
VYEEVLKSSSRRIKIQISRDNEEEAWVETIQSSSSIQQTRGLGKIASEGKILGDDFASKMVVCEMQQGGHG